MKIGLVLGSGGVSGAAHIAVIEALEKNKIKPEVVCGSSIGAILGLVYCNGGVEGLHHFVDHLEENGYFRKGSNIFRLLRKNIFVVIKKYLQENIAFKDLGDLPTKLLIVTTNLITGERKIISHGDPIHAVLASASIPGFFKPKNIDGQFLIDGGVSGSLPVFALENNCDYIIGSLLNPMKDRKKIVSDRKRLSRLAVFTRSIEIMQKTISAYESEKCNFCFYLPSNPYRWYEINKLDLIINNARREIEKQIKDLLADLGKKQ